MKSFFSVILVVFSFPYFVVSGGAHANDFENAITAWEESIANIRSYDVYVMLEEEVYYDPFDPESDYAEPFEYKKAVRLRKQEGFRRIDPAVVLPEQVASSSLTWDGGVAITLNRKDLYVTVRPEPTTTIPGGSEKADYDTVFVNAYGSTTYTSILRERTEQSLSAATIDGTECVVLATPVTEEYVNYSPKGLRVYLDPQRGFMPRKIETILRDKAGDVYVSRSVENDLAEVDNGVWAVTRSVIKVWFAVATNRVASRAALTVDLNKSTFNEPLNIEDLRLKIPSGASIDDRITGGLHVYGEAASSEQHMAELVAAGKASEKQRVQFLAKVREKSLDKKPVNSGFKLLIAVNAVILVVIVAGFMRKRSATKDA